MADTEFTSNITVIPADWANDVNRFAYSVTDKAAAVLLAPVDGLNLTIKSADGKGNIWKGVTGAAPGTYSNDSVNFAGTIIIPSGGDGSSAWVRDYDAEILIEWFIDVTGVDDTVAFQEAANIGGFIAVRGNYVLTSAITLLGATTFYGNGFSSTITFSGSMAASRMFTANSVSDNTFTHIKFIGDESVSAQSPFGCAIKFQGGTRNKAVSCKFESFPNTSVTFKDTTDWKFNHNHCDSFFPPDDTEFCCGVNIEDESNTGTAFDNVIRNIGANDAIGIGMRVIVQTGGKTIAENLHIIDNTIDTCTTHGIIMYDNSATGSDANDSFIGRNIVRNTGMSSVRSTGNGIYLLEVSGVTINDNRTFNTNANTAVSSILQAAIACRSDSGNAQNVQINGNKCNTDGYDGISVNGYNDDLSIGINTVKNIAIGLNLNSIVNAIVNGNIILNYNSSGVLITTCENVNGTGNTINSSTDVAAIQTVGASTNCSLEVNNIKPRAAHTEPFIDNIGTGVLIKVKGEAVPTQGTWAAGDTVTYNTPTAGNPDYARCITAGSQGTWKEGAALAA